MIYKNNFIRKKIFIIDYRKYDRLMTLGFSILSNFQFFVRHIL